MVRILGYPSMAHSRLRLAAFTAAVPWGESESFVLTEIAEFRRRVQSVVVVPVRPGRSLFHEELAREISQIAIRLPVVSPAIVVAAVRGFLQSPLEVWKVLKEVITGSASWRVLLKNLLIFPKAVCVARLLRRLGVNHVHAHWASVPATMAVVAARLCGVPWSFTAHRWDIAENNLLPAKVRSASFARVISERGRGEVLQILGERDWPTLYTVHMGTTIPENAVHPSGGEPRKVLDRVYCQSAGGERALIPHRGVSALAGARAPVRVSRHRGWQASGKAGWADRPGGGEGVCAAAWSSAA